MDSFLSFGGDGEIQFNQKKVRVKVVTLESLIEYFIDPPSFVMTIGDTQTFNFQMKALNPPVEPPSEPPGPPVKTEVFLLDNAYKLTLQGVEWSNKLTTGNRQSNEFEYPFTPDNIGSYSIYATASCLLEEVVVPAKSKAAKFFFLLGCTSGVDVDPPKIEFFVNNKPLGSGSYYLGQEIQLEARAKSLSNASISFNASKWSSNDYLVKGFDPGLASSPVTLLSPTEMFSPKIKFFLWSPPSNSSQVSFRFLWAINDHAGSNSVIIVFQRPKCSKKPGISSSFPRVATDTYVNPDTNETINNVWYIGYATPSYGIEVFPVVHNETDIQYAFAFLQLFQNAHERSLVNGNHEFALTKPSGFYWKDGGFPYLGFAPVSHNTELELNGLFEDAPKVALDDNFYGHSTTLQVSASASYRLFLMAKITPTNEIPYEKSIWCPIIALDWVWGGKAERSPTTSIWSEIPSTLYFQEPLEIKFSHFPDWVGCGSITWGVNR
ncbi:MAG: hypothetical protein ACD_13C00164G0001 [uncultured bacterium]|nr:MAG: hypothetical protein ACD_13C00164G0001 [uncultured bacterium]